MGDDLSVKNLVGRTIRDPWKAVLGSRPNTYQISEVGTELTHQVDRALFERKIHTAITNCIILEKWSIARQPATIQRIARKALEAEEIPRIRGLIERVIKNPTHDAVLKWRESLQSYVPPFPVTA